MAEQATKQLYPEKKEEVLDRLINNCSKLNALEDLFEGFNDPPFVPPVISMHGIALILRDIRQSIEDLHSELDEPE